MSAGKVDVLLSMAALADSFDQAGQPACGRSLMADRAAVADLIAGAQKFRREFDAEVANNEGENGLTDPGCNHCTSGCTPIQFDTGLCGYHALSAALARVSP